MFTQRRRIDQRLRRAAQDGAPVAQIHQLLNDSADRTSRDEYECTALYYAIMFGHTHLLAVLSTADILNDVIYPHAGRFYQHIAIEKDDAVALRQLLQLGCDVNVREKGLTLLTYALSRQSYACALVILGDSRFDVNAQAHSAALEYVLFITRNYTTAQEMSQRTEVLKRLLERGLQADCQSGGWTPLNHCIRYGLNVWVKLLLDHNAADVNVKQQGGLYPVLTAAVFGNHKALALLIATNAADMCLTSDAVTSTRQYIYGMNHIFN